MKKIKLPKSMKSSENMIHCPACCTQRMTDTGRLVRGKKTFHKIKKICSNCGFRLGR